MACGLGTRHSKPSTIAAFAHELVVFRVAKKNKLLTHLMMGREMQLGSVRSSSSYAFWRVPELYSSYPPIRPASKLTILLNPTARQQGCTEGPRVQAWKDHGRTMGYLSRTAPERNKIKKW